MAIRRSERGFTFVELAAVMIISGLIVGGVTQVFKLYNLRKSYEHTQEALSVSQESLAEYVSRIRVYPCPASPSAAPGDADFGVANCSGANVRTVVGRDGLPVVIGAVPISTLTPVMEDVDLSRHDTLDGWGNQLTYAVTRNLTDPLTYNNKQGAIEIVDEFGISVVEPDGHAHFALVSHGPDGIGAYSAEGVQAVDCDTVTLPTPPASPTAASISQIENCDSDARFLSGLQNMDSDFYNDDFVNFRIEQVSNLWEFVAGDNSRVRNTNEGNVGIGQIDPRERLHIMGDLNANELHATDICEETKTNCMDITAVAGTGMSCGPNEVAIGISQNDMRCVPIFTAPIVETCDPGFAAVGFSTVDGVICEPLP